MDIQLLTGGYAWRIPHNGELLQRYMDGQEALFLYSYKGAYKEQVNLAMTLPSLKKMARNLMDLDNAKLKVSSMSRNSKFAVYFPEGISRNELLHYLEQKHIHPWKVLIPSSGNIFRVQWR